MLKIYNTLGKSLQEFKPVNNNQVGMYACGPTVYDYAHIGHGRKYVMDDLIKRALEFLGYSVKLVMNITDVGHLVSDGDEGEDKLEKGAKKAGKTVWEVAEFFTQDFHQMQKLLNISAPDVESKATDHIQEQIQQIQKLFTNGYAYDTPEAVYFDTNKFENYGELFGQKVSEKLVGVRDEVRTDSAKRNPADFVLWFKKVGHYKDHIMFWQSPWGDGFPGWHIECSAMSIKYLGDQFDIHTGGVDHISVHHTNEIAQAEGATDKKPFVRYWIHHEFITIDGQKMSKSLDNFIRVEDIKQKGFNPLALRYFFMQAHYRSKQNFTWESLEAAQKAYDRLLKFLSNIKQKGKIDDYFKQKFVAALEDDFNMPKALAVLWEVVASSIDEQNKLATILDFDKVLGLDLKNQVLKFKSSELEEIPPEVLALIAERDKARQQKDWQTADKIRNLIKEKFGINVTDKK